MPCLHTALPSPRLLSPLVRLHYADSLLLTRCEWLNSLRHLCCRRNKGTTKGQSSDNIIWADMFMSLRILTLGGAVGTHSATRIRSAHVHTHTRECTHACHHAVKAAVGSHPFSLLWLTRLSCLFKGEVLKNNFADDLSHHETECAGGARGGIDWRKWVFSPLLSFPTLWESCPVTLIRNELGRHESQHMLEGERGEKQLFCLLWQYRTAHFLPAVQSLCALTVYRWWSVTGKYFFSHCQ